MALFPLARAVSDPPQLLRKVVRDLEPELDGRGNDRAADIIDEHREW